MTPMTRLQKTISLLSCSLTFLGGCVAQDATESAPIDDLSPALSTTEDRPVSTNGLDPTDFWAPANQQALRALGGGALLDTSGALTSTPLLDTDSGRSVLKYVVRSALPEGVTVTSASGYSFAGARNLAPDWRTRALTVSEQRWMTASLLDHLNGLGVSVPIMLLGSHPALFTSTGDASSTYTVSDMTGFGNLFSSSPTAYVCAELGVTLACGLSASAYTLQRICGLSPTCGAVHLGLCNLFCSHDAQGSPTCYPLLGSTYSEAISTKVQSTIDLPLSLLCGAH